MPKYKKCTSLNEENEIARCGASCPQHDDRGPCPKSRSQYRVTATCWKVPDGV